MEIGAVTPTIWRSKPCKCGAWTPKGWARCHCCGEVIEYYSIDDQDIIGGEKMEENSNQGAIVETKVSISKDGKWLIHKTIITDIKSVNYYKVILDGKEAA